MRMNTKFEQQFEISLEPTVRSKALSFFKSVSENKPGMMERSGLKITDETDGTLIIQISDTREIEEQTLNVMRKFLYSLKKC